ncbi:MAG: hypothetical protein KC493_12130 [Bacteriovoracaceae bacterium]|nr:hypothetical protein [Bacteriovoracaceae bacterium]
MNWFPIELDSLKYFNHSPVCIYLELKENNKYIKLLKRNSPISSAFLHKYRTKNIEQVFIEASDKGHYQKMMESVLMKFFDKRQKKSYSSFQSYEDVHKKTHTHLASIGFSEASTNLAMASIADLKKTISDDNNLRELFVHFKNTEGTFNYRLSYMTSVVAHILVRQFSWCTPEISKSILYAAIFADMGLSDDLVLIRTESDFSSTVLSKEDKEKVYYHAQDNAKKLIDKKGIPSGAAKLINEHHGQKTGVGFTKFIANGVSNISICLLLSQEFSFYILNHEEKDVKYEDFVEHATKNYTSPRVKSILLELGKCLVNKLA